MFAPKASKSDKGQNIDRGAPDGSSSEFSEDDTPLAVRLNWQGSSRPNDAEKQRPRAALSKKGGFVIPRKKKQANELLQVSNFNAREGKELLRHVIQSYRDTAVGATFKFEKLELVHNDQLSREFQDKKQSMRNIEGRNARELEDKFAFLYTVDRNEAKKICEVGLEVGSVSISCLGDPSMGVYLCRHADVISKKPLLPGVPGYLIVFKVIKGKVKPVTERSAPAVTDLLEPTPNFDCHVSRSVQSLPANSPLSQVFEYSQYYFYEFAEEGDDLHVKRPRKCLPYALVTFTMVDSSAPHQEPSVLQEELPNTDNNGFLPPAPSVMRHETRIAEKRRGRSSHVIWMGKVANKDRILAEAQLVCHSVQKIKLPFEIGEKIVMKEKISFQQLRPFLTFPLFHSGPPSATKVCQASLAGGTSFLHCDLLPVEDDHGKIEKLVKFFQEKNWAGIVKCPDANRVIFLIPTSQITLDLGITTVDSPAALHVLLFVKNQKSNKGSEVYKAVTSGSVREKDSRDVNQIQKELKRQLSLKVEVKEKPTEHRRLSLDSARPVAASGSSNKNPRDIPEFALQSNEQAAQWRNAVQNWLSRPHPLGGTEADLQKAAASSGIGVKAAHLSSSVAHVPKPRVPTTATPLSIPFQAVHARSSASTEQYRVISGQQDANAKSSVSAEEHKVISGRQDGCARFSVSTEEHRVISVQQDGHARSSGNAEQHRLFAGEHSDIISRQVKQDNVIEKEAKPSVTPVMIRKEEHREDPRLKMRHSLDEELSPGLKSPNLPQIGHGTPYNAEEALQAQGVKLESTSISPVSTPTASSTPQLKYQVNDKSIKELLDKINVQKQEESAYKVALDDGTRRALEMMKQQEGAKKSKPELPEAKMIVMDANTDGKLVTAVRTSDDKSVKRSSSSASAAQEKVKRIKINNVNPVRENVATVKAEVPTPSSRGELTKRGERGKGIGQTPRERSEKKPQREPKTQNDPPSGQEITKPVVETAVPELSEAPFPKILSPETLRSPPTSDFMSKAPKFKLILRTKDQKEVSAQSLTGNNRKSSEDALVKQPNATEDEQKGDLERDRKSIDSPVSMDISPQTTMPSGPELVSPITVVSSKGRYQTPVPPTSTPTTLAHSVVSYPTPVSSSFPFTPPLPEGPYRSAILPCSSQPRPPPPGQQPVHPMPCGPPLPAASSSGTTPSLPGAPPVLQSPPVSSAPSGGCLPFNPPLQDASSFVPHSAIPPSSVSPATSVPPTMGAFAGSPSYPPPPPAHPASVQRKNSIDALPNAVSSSGQFLTTFPGQQWTGAHPHSQGFVFPLPGVVAIPPTEVPRWPANSSLPRPGLPPPVLPPTAGRPPHVFPHQLPCPSQTTPFPGLPGKIRQPQGGGFVPIGVRRFHVPPMPPTGPALPQRSGVPVAAQITPVHPRFGAVPMSLQFQPRRPIGYWVAPLKVPAVQSGKTTGHVGRMPSYSPAQKHSKELQQTPPSLPQKNKEPSVEKAQNENREQNKENSNDAGAEGPANNASVQKEDDKEKSNAQLEKQREVAVSKIEVTDVDNSKEDKVVTATSDDKKATPSKDEEIESEAVEESDVGSVEQLSRDTDKAKVQDSEKLSFDQTVLQEPQKPASECALASDSAGDQENQTADELPGQSNREDSKEQRNKGSQESDVAASVSSKVCSEVEEPSQMTADEFKNSRSQVITELSSNFGDKHIAVSVSGTSAEAVEIDSSFCLPTITYQTEAERKGSKAVSKIYDILRQNAQQSRSETESVDQEEVEDLDDADKPDNPDPCAADEDLNANEEGIAEEEKLLFSGEESTASEQAVHLDSGLRVVQLLELDGIHDKDKERTCEESATLVSNVEHEDGQPQEELPSHLPTHEKQQEMLPRDSEFEDISDVSDEGTPERDLPGYGSVDIEQVWSSKAVDTAHSTVPVSEAAPVDTLHSTVPVSEAVPVLSPKEVSKPRAEVVHNKADSSSSTTEKHKNRKRHITVQSQKRKRWDSTSEDNDANKSSSLSKRSKKNTDRRRSSRKSPDRHNTVGSTKKGDRDRRTSGSSVIKSDPPSRRIVSGFKGGSLQITILRDTKSEEVEVKEEEANSPETRKSEEKPLLADVEYSDLEDISPGRLSSDDESPPTPPTPETATPAMDFTHPSLGFWAAPLKTNEPAVSGSAVVEEHQVSGKEILAPLTHASHLEERPVNLEPSQVRYPLGEVKFYEDEPFIGQSSWPVEGFFCQTTTSEERDLVGQGVEKDPLLIDDSAGHYLSRSSQESEEDITRYAQEFPPSEVFEYGHGVRDRLQPQEKLHRSSGHVQSRGMQKEVKHRSTIRETRYPWKTREESKHAQVPSAGGEGLASASQSATGKNIGCDEESSKHTTKRHKVVKAAHSTNDSESVGAEVRDWEIYVFAWMKKPQFENWIRRKNFGAKLAASGKCSVVLTPEHVRRSSERLYRRVKKRLRRACQSSRPNTEDLETSDCLEFDFDDMDVESNCVKAPSGHKEQSCSSVSKELPQCDTITDNNNVERCTVHSTHIEHPASPGTERSEVVHKHVNINAADECSEAVHIDKMDDLMCDKEVSIIFEQGVMDEVSASNVVNVGNNDANNSVAGSLTSELAGKNISVKTEQHFDVLVEDQTTMCEEDDMTTSPTSEAEVGCVKQQDATKEDPVAKLLDESKRVHSDSEGNGDKVTDGENEHKHVSGCEEANNEQDGPSQEQCLTADINSVSEAEGIRAVDLSVNAQHDQGMEETPEEVKGDQSSEEASLMHTKDTVAEDVKMDVTGSHQAGVLKDTLEVTDDHESRQDPASVARQGNQEVENVLVHKECHDVKDESVGEGNKAESQTGAEEGDEKPPFIATSEPQTNVDGHFDKAPVVLEDKTSGIVLGKTNTAITNKSPIVSSVVTSSDQLKESRSGSSTTVVSTPNQPKVFNLPALQRPSFNAVTTPIVPVTSCFPAFQPFPPNLVWPVTRHASPFTIAGIVPVHAPTQQQGKYGFDPSWVNHPPHAPIPVGCVRSHSTSDDICPPGTENISLEPSIDPADLAQGAGTQEETSKSTDDKPLHESVMDNSVVTALMQFYSEIEEVEGSENNGVERASDTTETNSGCRVPEPVEESAQTKGSKSHETTSDMEVESDREGSNKGVSEDAEMSEIGDIANPVLKRTESLERAGNVEGKNGEVQSTGTSTKQSQTAGGIVCSKVDITLVENRVDRTKVENPDVAMEITVMKNLETTKDETQAENPDVDIERKQVTNHGVTGYDSLIKSPDIAMDGTPVENLDIAMDITPSENPDTDEKVVENSSIALEVILAENPNAAIDQAQVEKASVPVETILAEDLDVAMNETLVDSLDIAVDGTQMEDPCIAMGGTHREEPDDAIMEGLEEEHPLSPIDPLFMASAEQTIFSSIGDLRNLLGQSSTFDLIAEEAIASTVSSLEDVLRQAQNSYLESSSCPSDSGMSMGEEVSASARSFSNIPLSRILLQDGDASKIGPVPGWSTWSCGGVQSQVVSTADARANDRNGTTSSISKEKHPTQKKIKKPAGHRTFYFYVYSPEYDRECEAVKNYMLKAGGTFVDVKDSACLEENSRELKVFIRRKHLPAVHRLANLYQLKMSASVRFSLFSTLTDVIEGSRFYENIFVSGGALLADDSILKTIELDHLDALLRYLKEQSVAHQKFVWVLNISRNGYKKLSLNRPQTERDSKVLNLIRQYREEGFITVLQKGYVAEGMPAVQRYLQTSLKLQIDLISVYRHVILLSDMDKNRMEVPWFLERGIGVMKVHEFLTTFAGERGATSLLAKRPIPEVTVKESSTVAYCSTPEDEAVSQTPEGTPVSDSSIDSPYTDMHALELPRSTGAPQKRAVRSLSLDAGTMTHTRLQILSCVRTVRDNIRSQISSSSPSSPVSRSM